MKSTTILFATLGLALGSLQAQTVPTFINYQGKVTDSAGVGLGTGTPVNRKVIFRVYDAPTAGNKLWTEEQTVTISNGDFSVLLGQGINATGTAAGELRPALDTVFTSFAGFGPNGATRFLGVTVDNGDATINASDVEISPRQQITSTAYCFRARAADTITAGTDLMLNNSANYGLGYYGGSRLFNGTSLDGPVLYGFAGGALGAVNGATQNIAMRWNAAGQVGIGTATLSGATATNKLVLQGDDANTPPQQLVIRGNTDITKRLVIGYRTDNTFGSIQAYSDAATPSGLALNPSGGNVGIGNPLPAFPLSFTTNTIGDKISLFGGPVTSYGFGIQGALLQIHSAASTDDIAFGYGSSAAMTETMRIEGTGNVGIGTTAPTYKLDVNGDMRTMGDLSFTTDAHKGLWWKSSTGTLLANIFRYTDTDDRLYFTNKGAQNLTGVYIASGGTSIVATSDERLKSDIEPLTHILDKIKDIRVVGFNMADLEVNQATGKVKIKRDIPARTTRAGKVTKHQIGSIAQDWLADFPELVVEPKTDDQYYGLNYDRIGVVALGAVKELHAIVSQKDARIADLEKRLAALEAREQARAASSQKSTGAE